MSKQAYKRSDEPIRDILVILVEKVFSLFFNNDISMGIQFYLQLGFLSWFASFHLRHYTDNSIISIIEFFVFIVFSFLYLLSINKYFRIPDGPPLFGELGGPGKRLMKKVDLAQSYIDLELDEKDAESINKFKHKMLEGYQSELKDRFHYPGIQKRKKKSNIFNHLDDYLEIYCADDIDEFEWEKIWREIIDIRLKTMTFGEIFGDRFLEFQHTTTYFERSTKYFKSLFSFCSLTILLFVVNHLLFNMKYISVLRYEVLLGVLTASIWYIVGMYQFSIVHFKSHLVPGIALDITLRKTIIGGKFYNVVRNYELIDCLFIIIIYFPIYLFCIGGSWAILALIDSTAKASTQWHFSFYSNIIIGYAVLLVSFYLTSFLIQHYRAFFVGMIVGMIPIIFTPVAILLITGEFNPSFDLLNPIDIILIIVSVFTSVLATLVAEQFKKVNEKK